MRALADIPRAGGTEVEQPLTPNLFFVGDNRTTVNWGRAASIALAQLLSQSFQISGRVTCDLFDLSSADAGYVSTLMPAKYYRHFRYLMLRKSRWPFAWYMKLETLLGAADFIAEDPVTSVNSLLAHKRWHPPLARIYDQAAQADLLVLDGDGDIIFTTPPRRSTLFLLAMIELGVRLNKPVFLVNSMISDCPITGRNQATLAAATRLLRQCRAVALRDPASLEYVEREMPGTNCSLIPDSLFTWFPHYAGGAAWLPPNGDFLLPYPEKAEYWGKLDFSVPYICLGGGALVASQRNRSIEGYGRLLDAVSQLGYRVYLTQNDLPDGFLQQVARNKNVGIVPADAPILACGSVLANARLFISGRYHPSILASLGGTPCIFLGSHAHKMRSLSRVLEYGVHREFPAFPNDSEIAEIVSTAQRYLGQGESLRAAIRGVAKARCEEAGRLPEYLKRHLNG